MLIPTKEELAMIKTQENVDTFAIIALLVLYLFKLFSGSAMSILWKSLDTI